MVVADTDVLQDRFWVRVQEFLGQRIAVPNAANASLVINALDNLTGSADLISVRNRGTFVRPFEKVNELRQAAEREYRQKEQELVDRLPDATREAALDAFIARLPAHEGLRDVFGRNDLDDAEAAS